MTNVSMLSLDSIINVLSFLDIDHLFDISPYFPLLTRNDHFWKCQGEVIFKGMTYQDFLSFWEHRPYYYKEMMTKGIRYFEITDQLAYQKLIGVQATIWDNLKSLRLLRIRMLHSIRSDSLISLECIGCYGKFQTKMKKLRNLTLQYSLFEKIELPEQRLDFLDISYCGFNIELLGTLKAKKLVLLGYDLTLEEIEKISAEEIKHDSVLRSHRASDVMDYLRLFC